MNARRLRRLINLWPPLLFAGIRVTRLSDDFMHAETQMKLNRFNRNYMGVAFGGSLFAMTDPLYMMMLHRVLGPGYVVWDKAGSIDYVAPGRGTVTARFDLDEETLETIRRRTENGAKYLPQFNVTITDAAGAVVATAIRTVYVRQVRPTS